MSLAPNPLNTVTVIDPIINFSQKNLENTVPVYKGASAINVQKLIPAGGNSSTNGEVSWNIFMPSRANTCLSRNIVINYDLTVTLQFTTAIYTGTGGAAVTSLDTLKNIINGRLAPTGNGTVLGNAINNVTVDFDGVSYSSTISEWYPYLSFLWRDEDSLRLYDSTSAATLPSNRPIYIDGSKNNVLSSYNDQPYDTIPSSGSFPKTILALYPGTITTTAAAPTTDTPAYAKVVFHMSECIPISPFITTSNSEALDAGFLGISNIKLKFTFGNSLFERCMRLNRFTSTSCLISTEQSTYTAGGNPVYSIPVLTGPILTSSGFLNTTILPSANCSCSLDNFSAVLSFYTLPLTVDIPQSVNYSWNQINYFTGSTALIPARVNAAAGGLQLTSTSYQLSSIPNAVFIAVVPFDKSNLYFNSTGAPAVNNVFTQSTFDLFTFPITNINITYANQTGILSSATADQLYQYSLRNGLRWINYGMSGMSGDLIPSSDGYEIPMGAPLILRFSKEIFTNDVTAAPNLSQNTQFQYTVNAINHSLVAQNVKLLTCFIYEGILTLNQAAGAVFSSAVLSRQDIVSSDENDIIDENDLREPVQTAGSGLWSGIRKFGKKAYRVIKSKPFRNALNEILEVGSEAYPALGKVKNITDAAYNTMDSMDKGSGYSAGRLLNQNQLGSGMRYNVGSGTVGGSVLSAKEIRQRLMK